MGALGQIPADWQSSVAQIMSIFTGSRDAWATFVAFTMQRWQQGSASKTNPWTVDPYFVGESVRILYETYGSQNLSEAAAFGLRFPLDLRNDIAFGRVKALAAQYQGKYKAHAGNPDVVERLLPPTENVFYAIANTYRSLQVFLPAFSIVLQQTGMGVEKLYNLFVPPKGGKDFVRWAIAGNTFMFNRARIPNELLKLLSRDELKEVRVGEAIAVEKNDAELKRYQQIGVDLDIEIAAYGALEFILKILALPAQAVEAIGKSFFSEIPWYAWLIGAGVGVAAIYSAVKK